MCKDRTSKENGTYVKRHLVFATLVSVNPGCGVCSRVVCMMTKVKETADDPNEVFTAADVREQLGRIEVTVKRGTRRPRSKARDRQIAPAEVGPVNETKR